MKKLLALLVAVGSLAAFAPSAFGHSGIYTDSFNGGLPGGNRSLSCAEAQFIAAASLNQTNLHGGYLRSNCLDFNLGGNPERWRLGVRAKDNALLYTRVTAFYQTNQAVYTIETWHQ